MATVEQTPALITAEEFARRPDSGMIEELVRGRIVMSPLPNRRHGFVCARVVYSIGRFLEDHALGRVFGNDSAIVIRRDPDTVRGADAAYYSFQRLPTDADNVGYGPEIPELAVEVLSPSDRWKDVMTKVGDYLGAGVLAVVVLDPEERTARMFEPDEGPRTLGPEDVLKFEAVLPGFEVVVGRLFE
ncbi:Uma2 family endonuclease [Paludisphaera mucosa]|uniref:Uma2 family endonuclease n=1 Tax=Paludisphaera mucosa TaxID=3030827 RepID=A0ABT6FC92_9BACT|nr:Uma2 family endonuclease [Paludisphaera mucosa]MDG3005208.1 Uma2 family endonuclease [Paludisphaera mucosa]